MLLGVIGRRGLKSGNERFCLLLVPESSAWEMRKWVGEESTDFVRFPLDEVDEWEERIDDRIHERIGDPVYFERQRCEQVATET